MEIDGDSVAEIVQKQFESLPQKRKPNGTREWVPLSGVVTQGHGVLRCVALGTGMKCLPQTKISQAKGVVLHDWHAEIVALRSLNQFLLKECLGLALSKEGESEVLRWRTEGEITEAGFQPFALREGVRLHMYCSEAPCGDASMELTMAAQEDATPWDHHPPPKPSSLLDPTSLASGKEPLLGRGHFSHLGIVRRKPSRPDAPPTLSKSCSDKLAMKQCTSLLCAAASLLIAPENAYLHSLTLPESQYSATGCERAFSAEGRMRPVGGQRWEGGYRFHPFRVQTTGREFRLSRRSVTGEQQRLVPSNVAAAWTPYGEETLIGGVLQGRKQFDPKGASMICRKSLWRLALEVAGVLAVPAVQQAMSCASYQGLKSARLLDGRRQVKEDVKEKAMQAWAKNEGDDFVLDL